MKVPSNLGFISYLFITEELSLIYFTENSEKLTGFHLDIEKYCVVLDGDETALPE